MVRSIHDRVNLTLTPLSLESLSTILLRDSSQVDIGKVPPSKADAAGTTSGEFSSAHHSLSRDRRTLRGWDPEMPLALAALEWHAFSLRSFYNIIIRSPGCAGNELYRHAVESCSLHRSRIPAIGCRSCFFFLGFDSCSGKS